MKSKGRVQKPEETSVQENSRAKKIIADKKCITPSLKGDLLSVVELSEDEGALNDAKGDNSENYNECEHFKIQTKHSNKLKQLPSKGKCRTSKKKKMTIKLEIKKKVKVEVKVKLENMTDAAKKKKLARKRREARKLILYEGTKTEIPGEKIIMELPTQVKVKTEPTSQGEHNVIEEKGNKHNRDESNGKEHQKQQQGKLNKTKEKIIKTSVKNRKRKGNNETDDKKNSQPKKTRTKKTCGKLHSVVDNRTLDPNRKMFVGAHTSITGGLYLSVIGAVEIKAHAFGLFLKSQRQWKSKPLEEDAADKFKQACEMYGFLPQYILPHGSYLMNLGSPDEETLQKSRDMLVDELKRCEKLGLILFNFHPGSTCGKISVEKCLENIAESINQAHSKTNGVITVIENMSCQGNTVGGKFEELRGIIDKVKDKSRVGVCLDTCHAFAAGFDLSTQKGFSKFVTDFENTVGFQYLKALHLNDSKGAVGCHLDRHENIGKGYIGKSGFKRIMNYPKFQNIPMILETPLDLDDAEEVEMLYAMCKT